MMSSTPAADVAKPANVTPEKLDTNQQTHALPWWIGRRWFAITYCVSKPYNFHYVKKPAKGGGKKGGGGDSQEGHCDIAGLVACGAADFLEAIEVNGDIVWSVPGGISRDGSHAEHTGDIVVDGVGTFRLHWGTETAAGDWLILNSGGEEHPYYRGQVVLEVQNLNCGSSESLPNIRVLLERAPVFPGLDGSRSREGANPITGIAELVENEFFGLGLKGTIDVTTAAAAASAIAARTKVVSVPGDPTHTASMGYLSAYVSDRQSFGSVLAAIMENYDGWVRRNGEKLELGFFTHPGATPPGLVELSIHDLIDDPDFANRGPDDPEVITDAIVTGPDREWNMEDSYQKAGNDAVRERIQQLRSKSYARPFIVTSYQQKEQAQELVNFYSQPAQDTTLKWRREKVGTLQPGDRFILNYSPSSLRQVFRIKGRSDPASGGAVTLTIEPERGLSPLAYIPVADPAPARPVAIPAVPITNARMFQLPVNWPDLPALPAFVPLAQRPSGPSKGFRVNFSVADVTYDAVAETNFWALAGALDNDVAIGDGGMDIMVSGMDITLLEEQSDAAQEDDTLLLIVGNEIMSIGAVRAIGGGIYNVFVNRGRRGSVEADHPHGAPIWIIPRAELEIVTHADFPRAAATRYFKLQSFTPGDVQDLSSAPKLTVSVTATIPDTPVLTALAGTGKSVSLSWPAITLAAEYGIWRNTSNTPGTAVKVAEVSGLRFVDVDVTLGTTYWYWVTAIDQDEQASPKSNGVSAMPTTVSSASLDPAIIAAINSAQADATAANAALANIASDSILSPVEKPAVVLDYTNLTGEQAAIDAQATTFGITTEKTAYDTALAALTTYLGTLSGWNTIPGTDVAIVGPTFRAKFADVYAARQTLLNKIAGTINPVALAAINAAQADATAANTALANIASDSILSPVEKPAVVLDYTNLTGEQAALDAQATTFGITTEKTAYDTALAALTTYLGTLSGWNTIPGTDVAIVGPTFRAKFADVYAARQTLLNKIAATANPTAPSNPAAPTLNTSGTYIAGDGTVFARLVVNVPVMPAGALLLNVLYRRTGSSGWIVGDQRSAGGGTSVIDDLAPGQNYDLAVQAFTADAAASAIVPATGNPFTAPNKTTAPNNPTGFAAHSPSSGWALPPRYLGPASQYQLYGCTVSFTSPADRDIAFYEIATTLSSSTAPTGAGSRVAGNAEQFYYYTATLFAQYLWFRTCDTSGNYSAWLYLFNVTSYVGLSAGTLSVQNTDAVAVTGIATGSGASVRKVLTRAPINQVYTTVGGSPSEVVDVDLTGSGFHTAPDAGLISASDPGFGVEYYPDAGSPNSATNARVTLFTRNGSNLGANWNIKIHGEFIEYD